MLVIADLRTQYATNPLGIGEKNPGLSWILRSTLRNTVQQAYRIQAATTWQLLEDNQPDLWDTGKVLSAESISIPYAGRELTSGQRCYWRVQVWDNHGRTACSQDSAWFELGLLHATDWKARWMGCLPGKSGDARLFRKDEKLTALPVRARAYVAGLGYYELYINGQKIGDRVLDPACSSYGKRVLYSTFDVTTILQMGRNRIGMLVGHGWYGLPKFILQIDITFEDGSRKLITSDWGWQTAPSPITSDSIIDGEDYDATLEIPDWNLSAAREVPELDVPSTLDPPYLPAHRRWYHAILTESPGGKLVASELEPIRVVSTLRPREIRRIDGAYVVDFGQNFAGWARIRVTGKRGDRVCLRYAESLYDNGMVNQENLLTARATDSYTLKGGDVEQWEPRFTYHGFRYVQVEGWPGELSADDIDGRVVRSDVARRGEFESDHPLINQIQNAVLWTEGSNLHGIPTDCPQRNERMGWLNDITARAEEAIYNYDMMRLYTKWLDDIADAQDTDGAIPDTVPYRFGHLPADPVCIGYLLLPWLLYQHYGDSRLIRKHYAGMKAWVDYLTSHSKENMVRYSYWGDWAPPVHRHGSSSPTQDTPRNLDSPGELVSTAFYAFHAHLLSQIAEVAGQREDQKHYAELARRIAASFNQVFWDERRTGYGSNNQTCNTLALYIGLAPPERIPAVIQSLVHNLVHIQDGHLATGNICTKYLPEVLTAAGHAQEVFDMVTKETYPSWGYMLANGATTMWERWENSTGSSMNSHNHPMFGSISAWFYRALAGLQMDPAATGASRLMIRPALVSGLHHVKATLQTVRGEVSVNLERRDEKVQLDVQIPVGSTATICIPRVSGGRMRIRLDESVIWAAGEKTAPENLAGNGVTISGYDKQYVRVTTGSGNYNFVAES